MQSIDIYVRDSGGAYVTNTINRERTSCTHSALEAARRQAEKVFGPALQKIVAVDKVGNASLFRATADDVIKAWCWASGLIEFGATVPEKACHFASGPDRALRQRVAVLAREGRGKSSGKLLMPGIPEAANQSEAMDALLAFEAWAGKANGNKGTYGVVFGKECRS